MCTISCVSACIFIYFSWLLHCFLHVCAFSLEHMLVFLELTRAYLSLQCIREQAKTQRMHKYGKKEKRRESHAWRRERNLPHPANAFFGLDNLLARSNIIVV